MPFADSILAKKNKKIICKALNMFFKESELERYGLQAGDVLVCEGGEPGRAAFWEGHLPGMMYQKTLYRVRFIPGYEQKLLIFLLEYLAKSGRFERWFTGSTIKHFTGESFAQLPIPVASNKEQLRIVEEVDRRLSLVSASETQIDTNLKRAERLRQSILQQAFTGRLVPSEPNGELACRLLDGGQKGGKKKSTSKESVSP